MSEHNNFVLEMRCFLSGRCDFWVLLRSASSPRFLFCHLASWNEVSPLPSFTPLYVTQAVGVYRCIQPLDCSVSAYTALLSLRTFLSHPLLGSQEKREKTPPLLRGLPYRTESEGQQRSRGKPSRCAGRSQHKEQ